MRDTAALRFLRLDQPPREREQPLAGGLQLFLRPPSLADVTNGARDERTLLRLEGTQADLRRELRAVLAQAVELHAGSHGPCARVGRVAGAMMPVLLTQARRHQTLDQLSQKLLPCVAEETLGLGVDEQDLPIPVHDDHRVRGRLQQTPELLLGTLAFGHVAGHAEDCRRPAGIVEPGGHVILDPDVRPRLPVTEPVLPSAAYPALEDPPRRLLDGGEVIRMDRPQPEPGIPQEVLDGVACDALVALSQRLFCPLPLSDVVEQSDELSLPRTVGGDREPDSKGLHVDLEPLRDSRQSHPAIHLEQLRTRLPYPGNEFGDFSPDHVLESRQDFEVRVDIQVAEVPRFAVLEQHLAVGVTVKHGLEERPIVLLAILDPLPGLPAGPALPRLLELPLNRGSEPRLPGALALRAVRHGAVQAPRQFGPARALARKRSGLQMKQILQTV